MVCLCAFWICVYISLFMNEQRVYMCGPGLHKEELSLFKCAMVKICLIAITPPSIQTGTCYHSALLLEAIRERLLRALTLLPFFHMNRRPSAMAHSTRQTALFLKKIRNKDWGNEFYCSIFTPSAYSQRHHTHPQRTFALPLLKQRKGKWILQPLVLSVASNTPCLPSVVTHFSTLPLSHYLTQRLEMNFTALSSLLRTIL